MVIDGPNDEKDPDDEKDRDYRHGGRVPKTGGNVPPSEILEKCTSTRKSVKKN